MPTSFLPGLLFLSLVVTSTAALAGPALTISAEKASATYALNEPIIWDVTVTDDPNGAIKTGSYALKEGGGKGIGQGTLAFDKGTAKIQTTLGKPGTILAEVTASDAAGKKLDAFGGAAVAWDKIQPSAPRPDDFDSFWKSQLDLLAAIPPNAVLTKEDSGMPNVDYWKITFDNVDGTHVQGQFARPAGDAKVPGMLIVQWAGVYPLQKVWVTTYASQGWMALDVSAHDLPIDQPEEFYDDQNKNALKDYTKIGDTDRNKSYFRRMFLGDIQAAWYLAKRPDWNGKTLVVTGGSQGGMQSYAVAGLDPQITALLAMVPAGCDDSGALVGRHAAWPFYMNNPQDPNQIPVIKTSAYFDPMNFAPNIKCPVLIGLGLIDQTAPPSGTLAAFNQVPGTNKEVVILPKSDHMGTNHSQAEYFTRFGAWTNALKSGSSAPVVGH